MNPSDFYMALPYDTSGSRSKNRFRVELLWGISKMLDSYNISDFTMVFDYVCDIELHINNNFEFYQLKSHKGTKTYTVENLVKIDKDSRNSILGKLYMLKPNNPTEPKVKLAIVSNAYLKSDKKVYSDVDIQPFATISQKSLDKIQNALKTELDIKALDMSDVYYICTPMNLSDPTNDVRGKLISTFEEIEGCEPKKPNALWRLIYDTVQDKACCELIQPNYTSLKTNKGITKSELKRMLDCHKDNDDDSVAQTKAYIDSLPDYKKRHKLKAALAKIISEIPRSRDLQYCEEKISHYLLEQEDSLPQDFEETINHLLEVFDSSFSIEYDQEERYLLCLLVLKRYEEGMYE